MDEYRHPFNHRTPNRLESRCGFASRLGPPAVTADPGAISSMLHKGGPGICLETKKRRNVRIDKGSGTQGNTLQVTFHEAF